VKIVIWTGAAWERWGPPSVDAGIGGSETAAVHMGTELARRGHEVVMFGDHEGYEGEWRTGTDSHGKAQRVSEPDLELSDSIRASQALSSPVLYRSYKAAVEDPKLLACDVLVSSRNKNIVRLKPDARAKVLWIHDVNVGDDWDNDLLGYDRIYCLSKWHRDYNLTLYPHVEPKKFSVTRNGIDPARFADLDWKKKTSSFVYSSSPDRGLDVLLDMWPRIKALRPDATLDVYYGFDTWRKLNAENKRGLAIVDYMFTRVTSMESEGVKYHGRVGQAELAEAHKKALIWAYFTRFTETYCITALEAQAAGCCVVTSKLAGLAETASIWSSLVEGSNKSSGYQEEALDWLGYYYTAWDVDCKNGVENPIHLTAQAARAWALKQTWAALAEEWERDFMGLTEGK
jgi:glycosyltransferase involved in cell wall biosynthesis